MKRNATTLVLILSGFFGLGLAVGVATGLGQPDDGRFVGTCPASSSLSCSVQGDGVVPVDDAGARHALSVRSQALNEAYGQREREPAWLRALRIRSEGLNRLYGLD